MDYKVKRAIASYGLKEATAVQEIERINKARAAHYQHYTGKRWNDINNYHLTCDTSRISSEQVCVMIEALYNERKASVTK
jgi:cytidylate kinase